MNDLPVYCINLSHRKDRWESVQKEFKRMDFDVPVNRYEAIKNIQGFIGCMLSHLSIIGTCITKPKFAIFEDDVRFLDGFKETLGLALEQLPEDWDILYLGGNPQSPLQKYSNNLFRAKGVLCHHAVIYNNRRIARYIIDHVPDVYKYQKIDVYFSEVIQEKFNAYIVSPIITTQSDSYSDITKRENKYHQYIIDQFNSATQ